LAEIRNLSQNFYSYQFSYFQFNWTQILKNLFASFRAIKRRIEPFYGSATVFVWSMEWWLFIATKKQWFAYDYHFLSSKTLIFLYVCWKIFNYEDIFEIKSSSNNVFEVINRHYCETECNTLFFSPIHSVSHLSSRSKFLLEPVWQPWLVNKHLNFWKTQIF
jgi:hypothetical protein